MCIIWTMEYMGRKMYLSYNQYLQEKYNTRVYRIAVDAGFNCPNRLAGRSSKGCDFCDEFGARAIYTRNKKLLAFSKELQSNKKGYPQFYSPQAVELQIKEGMDFARKRYKAEEFILYFQAFSSTNASVEILEEIYNHALDVHDFREFIISTRPDCIDEGVVQLLNKIKKERDIEIWIELGMQTADDDILEAINRGHSYGDFLQAFNLLRKYGIKIVVHQIVGLPGEDEASFEKTVTEIARLAPEGLKPHNLHLVTNTSFEKQFRLGGNISAPSMDRYLEKLIYLLEHVPKETIIMRITCDTPRHKLLAPARDTKKDAFTLQLKEQMHLRKSFQGKHFNL